MGINDGATYSETSAAAREEGLDADNAAELQGKADTLFKGESLRAMLLNAYGWWTVATIALWAGVAMVIAGLLMGILSILGFRHARKVVVRTAEYSVEGAEGTKSLVGSRSRNQQHVDPREELARVASSSSLCWTQSTRRYAEPRTRWSRSRPEASR